MFSTDDPSTPGLNSGHADRVVIEKGIKKSDGIAATTDACDEQIGQSLLPLQDLPAGLISDDPVKVTNYHRVGMGAKCRSQDVMRVADIGDPVTHRFVDGLLQGCLPRSNADDFRS